MNITVHISCVEAKNEKYLAFLKACGYDGVELLLNGDLSEIDTIKSNIEKAGLYIAQTELCRENAVEGLEVSARLGIGWACLPIVVNYDTDLVRGMIPHAERLGVGIALENPATHDNITDTFCIYVDSFKSDFVGMCYNIGHANLMGSDDFGIKKYDVDKAEAIRRAGDRIKILHVNDNHGDVDRKLCPTVPNAVCSVKWKEIIGALRDIGFDGAFSLVCPIDFAEYDIMNDYLEFMAMVSKTLVGEGEAK